ncbi:MAG: beta-ketoacyl-[acyl-carrier-protein] synthase family protein [Acidobacteriota bacterium]
MPADPQRVVITGVGVAAPGAWGYERFGQHLLQGESGIRGITLFDCASHECQVAGEVADLDRHDPLPAAERRKVSRPVPLALAAAREALDSAGLSDDAFDEDARERTGVILGSGAGGIEYTESQYETFFDRGSRRTSPYAIVASFVGMLASEVSIFFRLRGPSHVLSTGCTSATDAMGYALMQLRAGNLDRVITGGVEACITPAIVASFAKMGTVATRWNREPAKAARPFSRDRDGFVLSEGAWVFVFETERSARTRGAAPRAEVAGYGSTSDAYHRVQVMRGGEEPARAIQIALRDAGADPSAVDHVSLHGTGTELNDLAETRAVKIALGRRAAAIPSPRPSRSSVTRREASGALGVAAVLTAMERGAVPPTINLDEPDPELDLDYTPHRAREHKVSVAVANCIAFGAKNSALVLRALPR